MAETIRGINVVIGAETTGLSKALADVNKRSREIQSELRQVEQLLKFDPSNTELLAQKQKLLGEAIDNAREKLDRLRSVQEQVATQFQRGEISEGQFRAFQREIIKAEQELRNFESRLESLGPELKSFGDKAQEAADKLKNIGESIKNTGESMSVGLTAPLAGFAALAGNAANNVDSAAGRIEASLGVTKERAEELGKVAQDVWKKGFGESVQEAADTVSAFFGVLGEGASRDDLAYLAQGALTLAEAFGIDMTESVTAVNTVMKNFQVDGKQAMDLIMAAAQQTSGVFRADLADALTELAPTLHSMGASAEEAFSLMIAASKSGMENFDALSSLTQTFTDNLIQGGEDIDAAFEKLGGSAQQMWEKYKAGSASAFDVLVATTETLAGMGDSIAKNQAGVKLFGDVWTEAGDDAIAALSNMTANLQNVEGTAQRAGEALHDNFGAKLAQLWRSLQDDLKPVGDAILQIAQNVLPPVIEGISSLANWFANLSPAAQQAIIVIAGIAAAIGPLLMIIGQLATGVGAVISAFAAVSSAITAAGGVISLITSPIGIAIAAIAGLAAAAFLIIKNWEPIKEFFIGLWDNIVSAASTAWEGIKSGLSAAWEAIKSTAVSVFEGISTFFKNVWNGIISFLTGIWNGLVTAAKKAFDGIVNTVKPIMDGFKTFFSGIWEAIKNIFAGALLLIVDLVTGDFENLKKDAEAIWNNLKEAFSKIWEGIKQIFTAALNIIVNALSTAWNGIKTAASTAWNGIKTTISNIINATVTWIKNTWDALLNWFRQLPGKLYTIGSDMFNRMREAVATTVTRVKDAIVTGITAAINWLKRLPSELLRIGRDMIQGLINGIKSMIGKVGVAIRSIADKVTGGLRDFLDIRSPSRVMMQLGEYTGEGFLKGIGNTISDVRQRAAELAAAASSVLTDLSIPTININANIPSIGSPAPIAGGGGNIIIQHMVVRNDTDIQRVARELYRLQQSSLRARGGMA